METLHDWRIYWVACRYPGYGLERLGLAHVCGALFTE
jgi:hypothetical protein